jgi:UDP-N-acetylmuramate dehydrogenase
MSSATDSFRPSILRQEPLSKWTTFQLGGTCKGLIHCETPAELILSVQFLRKLDEPFILIGGGSNLVVSDHGLNCFVIRYVSSQPIIERRGTDLIVSASTSLDMLAQYALKEGLEGLNYTSGIPGTVGGAIVGNAGAFGKQVGDVLKYVTVLRESGNLVDIPHDELGFTYRHSHLKDTSDIVLSASFSLKEGDREALQKERDEILRIRHEKHPDLSVMPCAGSFFRNIEPTSKAERRQATGWFLEEAGGKSLQFGGAKIYEKHANIIIKSTPCKAQDIFELSQLMVKIVKDKFNLDLVREVRFVGEFTGKPESIKDLIW